MTTTSRSADGAERLKSWIRSGELKYKEDVQNGFENAPKPCCGSSAAPTRQAAAAALDDAARSSQARPRLAGHVTPRRRSAAGAKARPGWRSAGVEPGFKARVPDPLHQHPVRITDSARAS